MSPRRLDGRPSARELEVLQLLCRPGADRRSVAWTLGLSERTVDSHLRSLYRRLGVSSAAQAVKTVGNLR
jgi:LuxR family quorum sensing-dependent transcriptional regulator